MTHVLIDSNVLVALLDRRDVWHPSATELERSISEKTIRVIPDIVVIETVSVIGRRLQERKRSDLFAEFVASLRSILLSSKLIWLTPLVPSYYDNILDLMVQQSGALSFNDCLIALYLQTRRYRYLLSFDADFDRLPFITRVSSRQDVAKYLQ